MEVYRPGAIVIVPFPFADFPDTTKRRPAAVISDETLVEVTDLYWIAMITSARNPAWPGDIAIEDSPATGLPVRSVIRPAKIATLDRQRLERCLGTLPETAKSALFDYVRHRIPAV